MALSSKQVTEWREAHKKYQTQAVRRNITSQSERTWMPPNMGTIKVNVDASVYSFSIGMVARNHHGHFLTAKTMRFAGRISVLEAEMVGILEALLWLQELPHQRVIAESDSMISVEAVTKNVHNYLELGDLISQCHVILDSRVGVSVEFVKTHASKIAHKLARVPCALNNFVVNSYSPL